ncbi:radial spoke protein 3-domain-containing protein [Pelagophyceae sp. CCMP2097]|nr:radial spoke protein 3-domain-containing protein [Pelagophyceae sp. CCMP2097]|mmetsp:Transcript_10983/g.36705  ORF Transcript_10983/g.36705 Transcript_10983/m.36705 type:complete len:379 (-) Transcript_10983:236-1372(-)
MMGEGAAYVHSSSPKALSSKMKRSAYRDEDEENNLASNIMHDRRIVRGNTYAAQVVTQNAQREVERLRTENERTLRREATRRRREQLGKPATPPAVDGRSHAGAQTETYLEALADRPVEIEEATQTEPSRDRPPSPLFVPSKTGLDKATDIAAGELFDFDMEVAPILEVLVGKTLRLAMLECTEEAELEAIRQRQREFEQMRNAELMEVQRLDAEASRRFAEKQRRLAQERDRLRQQAELQEKVAARAFAKAYLVDLSDAVFDKLEVDGHFYDPVTREVQLVFIPWLMDEVVAGVDAHVNARAVADDALKAALDLAAATHNAEKARKKHLADLEAAKVAEAAQIEAVIAAAAAKAEADEAAALAAADGADGAAATEEE